MELTRRALIAAAVAATVQTETARAAVQQDVGSGRAPLPLKSEFHPIHLTYLDSGTMHPIANGARRAVGSYLENRSLHPRERFSLDETDKRVRERFAALINAASEEICLVQSTTAGEQLVVRALEIPANRGRIVTDTLHFSGSFYLYQELARRGMDVVWLRPRDGQRIDMRDIEEAVTKSTKLIALSLVSTFNGFQHDLKRVCEIAHANGAYVYADIIHAAGVVPVDVRASGVDFAACASYKWLMGDFGLGFLYVRADLLDKIQRPQYGYEQLDQFQTHVYPLDPPGSTIVDYTTTRDAPGYFAMGTTSSTCAVQLNYTLDLIRRIGVEAIQAHHRALLKRARTELLRIGYNCITPEEATSPLLTFVLKDARSLEPKFQAARVKIKIGKNHFRITPSVFNDFADIERLLEVLS